MNRFSDIFCSCILGLEACTHGFRNQSFGCLEEGVPKRVVLSMFSLFFGFLGSIGSFTSKNKRAFNAWTWLVQSLPSFHPFSLFENSSILRIVIINIFQLLDLYLFFLLHELIKLLQAKLFMKVLLCLHTMNPILHLGEIMRLQWWLLFCDLESVVWHLFEQLQ